MAFQRLKQFKDIELSYDATAAMTVKFYTDISAGVQGNMALVCTLTFPATTGRNTYTAPLDAGSTGATSATVPLIEGTLYQVVITSTGIVRLFGGLIRARQIGTWFNGANHESWTSLEQGIGI
jgi:hypothetical protein